MRIISHRGNLTGSDPSKENKPSQIEKCIILGFDVEVDVWRNQGKLYLGHDEATTRIDLAFLKEYRKRLWIHCKNIEAFLFLVSKKKLNVFYHTDEDIVLTSQKYFWFYPGIAPENYQKKSIAVMPGPNANVSNFGGVCVDNSMEWLGR